MYNTGDIVIALYSFTKEMPSGVTKNFISNQHYKIGSKIDKTQTEFWEDKTQTEFWEVLHSPNEEYYCTWFDALEMKTHFSSLKELRKKKLMNIEKCVKN